MSLALADLIERHGGRCDRALDGRGPELTDVELDSRAVEPGHLFCALPGARADGARFAPQALERGAAALLAPPESAEGLSALDVPVWLHPEARRATGLAAASVHGDPSERLWVVAITGTNGKTTIAHLLAQLLRGCGRQPACFGTVGHVLAGDQRFPAGNTTPPATILQRLLARHLELGGDSAVLEASSHALDQHRLAGLAVDVAVFTNLTRDHLDYHGTLERYFEAKLRLFEDLREGAVAVIPITGLEEERIRALRAAAEAAGARVVTYGFGSRADLSAHVDAVYPGSVSLFLEGMGIPKTKVHLPLPGRHNVLNALAASAALLSGGVGSDTLCSGLTSVSSPPGRLERVDNGSTDFRVLVDFAHTPEALAAALDGVRAELDGVGHGRLICLFGCGGDRDQGKRGPMGQAVDARADVVVLTSDNPRSERPSAITDQVLAGVPEPRAVWHVELDRAAAIARALTLAEPGDCVVLAGKGHEREQILGTQRVAFDDAQVARAWLAENAGGAA
ncbi:MAG: UDP-N-acetylmuramoyl-L-alanyl-D-glutamate--2,6-diaminopimelate ligase [Planctomycetota bacterium]|jgi:UDP-N-acetylmuramoyl-L-alanyl-D-glutamate--2,6-diaminopimelate ligase